MNHDVPSRRNLRPVAPQNIADAALDAVAHYRTAQSFLHADAEAADAPGVFRQRRGGRKTLAPGRKIPPAGRTRKRYLRAEENGKLRARAPLPGAVNSFVLHA